MSVTPPEIGPKTDITEGDVTRILREIRNGNAASSNELFTLLYSDLRRMASRQLRSERKDHTLQTTALVHEVYLKLTNGGTEDLGDRAHFFAVAAQVMRQILVDHARAKKAKRRGGELKRVELTDHLSLAEDGLENILLINDVLTKLEKLDPRQVRIVELRFFLDLSVEEIAESLKISKRTIIREWRAAQAWLHAELGNTD